MFEIPSSLLLKWLKIAFCLAQINQFFYRTKANIYIVALFKIPWDIYRKASAVTEAYHFHADRQHRLDTNLFWFLCYVDVYVHICMFPSTKQTDKPLTLIEYIFCPLALLYCQQQNCSYKQVHKNHNIIHGSFFSYRAYTQFLFLYIDIGKKSENESKLTGKFLSPYVQQIVWLWGFFFRESKQKSTIL